MNKIAVYHGSCLDGSSAAAVFKMKYPDARLFPIKSRLHTEVRDEILRALENPDSELFVLDNPWFIEDYAKSGRSITVIDHHIGAKEEVESIVVRYPNLKYIFDNNKSGASLTWSYFFEGEPIPKFIWHIEDGDLYRYEDKEKSKLVESYAAIYLDDIDKYIEFINSDIEKLYEVARPALDYQNMLIDYYMRNAKALHLKVGDYKIKAYNVASIRPVVSDFGNAVSKETKEPIVMFKIFGDRVNLSFRSFSEDFKPLPVELAQALGGNGHKLAAGASMPLKDFLDSLEESD